MTFISLLLKSLKFCTVFCSALKNNGDCVHTKQLEAEGEESHSDGLANDHGILGKELFLLDIYFFYLPDPSTMQNMSFKGRRRVMPGETINITSI